MGRVHGGDDQPVSGLFFFSCFFTRRLRRTKVANPHAFDASREGAGICCDNLVMERLQAALFASAVPGVGYQQNYNVEVRPAVGNRKPKFNTRL